MIEVLQRVKCSANSALEYKLHAIEELQSEYSIHVLCEALKVPRGTYYNHILRNKKENTWFEKRKVELREEIQHVFDEMHQVVGAKKIHAILKDKGYRTSEKMVRNLMQEMGLASVRTNAKKIFRKEQEEYKDRLQQQFNVSRPNEVWVSDITLIQYKDKYYYLCAIIDLYARRVIGYKISERQTTHLVKSTFKIAYEDRKPKETLLFHTDNGSQFKSFAFVSYLKSLGVEQSYSHPYTPYDNSVIESFFANLKREEVYRNHYSSEAKMRQGIKEYIAFYNEKRPHATNANRSPCRKEEEYWNNHLEECQN